VGAHPDLGPVIPPSPAAPMPGHVEIVDLEVRQAKAARPSNADDQSLARTAGETAMSLSLHALRYGTRLGGAMVRRAATSPLGRLATELAAGALDAVAEDVDADWQEASRTVEERLGRVISVVVPVVVESVDPVELMERIDVNSILESVDVDAIMDRVDIEALIARVDVNALLERVDVNALLDRVGIDALLARADVSAVLDRVDVDALLADVDVAALAKRAGIGDLVADATGDVAESTLDLGRRQAVALDTVLARTINRMLGRDSTTMPPGPPDLTNTTDVDAHD